MDIPSNALNDLRSDFSGELLTPDKEGYGSARQLWNAMIDKSPSLIARCNGVADVIGAVKFARTSGLPIAVRGGGHNVAGHAVCDTGVTIDLSGMRAVHVNPDRRTAVVEGGATWAEVDRETQVFGLATPGGLISETGVGGLTLSGGFGYLRGRHGLSIDNLLAAEVVTAEGNLVRASAEENSDLLWALKGGGGNFGVVVRFEFALHPVGPEVQFIAPIYALEEGPGPIRAWRDYVSRNDEELAMICEFSTVPEDDEFPSEYWGKKVFALVGVALGSPEQTEELSKPLRELGTLVTDFSGRMAYKDIQKLFDEQTPFNEMRCYWKARYLSELPDAMIDLAIENAEAAPSPNTISSLWNMGRAVQAVPASASAFGDRSMGWMYSADGVWGEVADDEANIAWARDSWTKAEPFGHAGRAYLNFPGHGEDGALTAAAFGENYARLREIKARFDPENIFKFNQNIPPA